MKKFEYVKLPFDYLLYRYYRLFIDFTKPKVSAYVDGCCVFFFSIANYVLGVMKLFEDNLSLHVVDNGAYPSVFICISLSGLVFPHIFKDYMRKLEKRWQDEDDRYAKMVIPLGFTAISVVSLFYSVS
ncbi:MAG: hypothetical protein IKX93_03245 [Bacteroidaceae bacterium]|nr:hypothetical protein [Bacteroidaceae bacterium]